MNEFRTDALNLLALNLDGPQKLDVTTRDKLLAHLVEHFTEAQLSILEETFSDLSDLTYTARRRAKGAREHRERVAGMADEQLVAANPDRSLAGALNLNHRPLPLRVLAGGGDAA